MCLKALVRFAVYFLSVLVSMVIVRITSGVQGVNTLLAVLAVSALLTIAFKPE